MEHQKSSTASTTRSRMLIANKYSDDKSYFLYNELVILYILIFNKQGSFNEKDFTALHQ